MAMRSICSFNISDKARFGCTTKTQFFTGCFFRKQPDNQTLLIRAKILIALRYGCRLNLSNYWQIRTCNMKGDKKTALAKKITRFSSAVRPGDDNLSILIKTAVFQIFCSCLLKSLRR